MYVPSLVDRVAGSAPLRRRQAIARVAMPALARVEVTGLEHVPTVGPAVLAVNHRAFLDGVLVFGLLERPITFLVKSEAFHGWQDPILRSAGQIPVHRGIVDVAPIRTTLQVLNAGGLVGVFPEGSRGDGLVHTAKPGVGYFALRSDAVVIPVACHGTELLASRRAATRPLVRFVFGPPLEVARYPADRPLNRRVVAATTERIRVALAQLVQDTLPPSELAA